MPRRWCRKAPIRNEPDKKSHSRHDDTGERCQNEICERRQAADVNMLAGRLAIQSCRDQVCPCKRTDHTCNGENDRRATHRPNENKISTAGGVARRCGLRWNFMESDAPRLPAVRCIAWLGLLGSFDTNDRSPISLRHETYCLRLKSKRVVSALPFWTKVHSST